MGQDTTIAWAHDTFNAWRGCQKVSEGCEHCYADTLSKRNPETLGIWGPMGTRVVAAEAYWAQLPKWERAARREGEARRVFCGSMCDVLENWTGAMTTPKGEQLWYADEGWWTTKAGGCVLDMARVRDRLYKAIRDHQDLTFMLLTKRAERIFWELGGFPNVPNLTLGVSVENQRAAAARVLPLAEADVAARFLSVEPLLGPVCLTDIKLADGSWYDALRGKITSNEGEHFVAPMDWVIIGGESGDKARRCQLDWIRAIVKDCLNAGVSVMVKQLGARPAGDTWSTGGSSVPLPTIDDSVRSEPSWLLHHPKGEDPNEWPPELRVQQISSKFRRPIR